MTEQYPKHAIDDEIEVRAPDGDLRGVVTGINFQFPNFMYIVELNVPFNGEFGAQTGLYVPESSLLAKPDMDTLKTLIPVGSYVCMLETEEGEEEKALDVEVLIATADHVHFYVVTRDSEEGVQPVFYSPYTEQLDAKNFAEDFIAESHEAAPGEDAAKFLARRKNGGE